MFLERVAAVLAIISQLCHDVHGKAESVSEKKGVSGHMLAMRDAPADLGTVLSGNGNITNYTGLIKVRNLPRVSGIATKSCSRRIQTSYCGFQARMGSR
jgi:hypothetical protein